MPTLSIVIKEGKQRLLDISLAVEKTHFIFTNLYGHCQERSISQKINNVGLIKRLAGNLNSFKYFFLDSDHKGS
jgi:hypothetical protein